MTQYRIDRTEGSKNMGLGQLGKVVSNNVHMVTDLGN